MFIIYYLCYCFLFDVNVICFLSRPTWMLCFVHHNVAYWMNTNTVNKHFLTFHFYFSIYYFIIFFSYSVTQTSSINHTKLYCRNTQSPILLFLPHDMPRNVLLFGVMEMVTLVEKQEFEEAGLFLNAILLLFPSWCCASVGGTLIFNVKQWYCVCRSN